MFVQNARIRTQRCSGASNNLQAWCSFPKILSHVEKGNNKAGCVGERRPILELVSRYHDASFDYQSDPIRMISSTSPSIPDMFRDFKWREEVKMQIETSDNPGRSKQAIKIHEYGETEVCS